MFETKVGLPRFLFINLFPHFVILFPALTVEWSLFYGNYLRFLYSIFYPEMSCTNITDNA